MLSVHGTETSVPYLLSDNYMDSLVSFSAEILSRVLSASLQMKSGKFSSSESEVKLCGPFLDTTDSLFFL